MPVSAARRNHRPQQQPQKPVGRPQTGQWGTKKIVLYTGLALAGGATIAALYYFKTLNEIPLSPPVKKLTLTDLKLSPDLNAGVEVNQRSPITEFPKNAVHGFRAGAFTSNGAHHCLGKFERHTPGSCDLLTDEVGRQMPSEQKGMLVEIANRYDNGFNTTVYPGMRRETEVHWWVPRVMFENQKKAVGFLEKTVLKRPNYFKDATPIQIVDMIKKLHVRLTQGISFENSMPRPGEYRNREMHVTEPSDNDQRPLLAQSKGVPSWLYLATVAKLQIFGQSTLSEREINVLNKVGLLTETPKKIPERIFRFGTELKEILSTPNKAEVDPIKTAAWVQQEVGEIHPFEDGNGRTARNLMNVALMILGWNPPIFKNDVEYTAAVMNGGFLDYLRQEVALQNPAS
jgi:hypothetical protein